MEHIEAALRSRSGETASVSASEEQSSSEFNRTFSQQVGNRWTTQDMLDLVDLMRKQLDIHDRTYHLKTYRDCFVGQDAVRWMLKAGVAGCELEAVSVGNRLLQAGLLRHVSDAKPFANKYLFYRFSDDEAEEGQNGGSDSRSKTTRGSSSRLLAEVVARVGGENTREHWTLATEVTRLQRRVANLAEDLDMARSMASAMFDTDAALQRAAHGQMQAMERRLADCHALCMLQTLCLGLLLLSLGGFLFKLVALLLLSVAVLAALPNPPRQPAEVLQHMQGYAARFLPVLTKAWGAPLAPQPDDNAEGASPVSSMGSSPSASAFAGSADGGQGGSDSMRDAFELSLPPTLADFEDWPDRPMLLRMAPGIPGQRLLDPAGARRLPVNLVAPFHFQSELFEGCAMLMVAGLASSPPNLFQGRRRKTHFVVQGRFRQRLAVAEVVTGQQFERPLLDLPAPWLISVLIKFARRLNASVHIGSLKMPSLLSPLLSTAQVCHVANPGEEPPIDGLPQEDVELAFPDIRSKDGQPLTAAQRKKHFADPRNSAGLYFDTERVWTFHFWQHLLDVSKFELDMGVAQFDLVHHLDGQPLQLMARTWGGRSLWNFEMWHQKLLRAGRTSPRKRSASSSLEADGVLTK